MVRALLLGALVTVVSGCPSRSKEPSAEYEAARKRFNTLYAERLDEAFLDPRMTEIEAQLAKVPEDSLDAEQARTLQQRIDEGQARMSAAREKHAQTMAEVRKPGPAPSGGGSAAAEPSGGGEAAPSEEADAGPSGHPAVGMSAGELSRRFGTCFRPGSPVEVAERGVLETWVLKDITLCAQRYAAFTDSTIVIESGKILTIVPTAKITTETRTVDGGAPSR